MLQVEQVVKVVANPVIGIVAIALIGIVHQVVVVNRVHAELKAVIALVPVKDVADLPLVLIGVGSAVLIVLGTGIKAVVITSFKLRHIGAGGNVGLGVGRKRLLALVVKFAAVLVQHFVADGVGDEAGELGHPVIELDEVVALRILGVHVGVRSLHA